MNKVDNINILDSKDVENRVINVNKEKCEIAIKSLHEMMVEIKKYQQEQDKKVVKLNKTHREMSSDTIKKYKEIKKALKEMRDNALEYDDESLKVEGKKWYDF